MTQFSEHSTIKNSNILIGANHRKIHHTSNFCVQTKLEVSAPLRTSLWYHPSVSSLFSYHSQLESIDSISTKKGKVKMLHNYRVQPPN